MADAASNPLPLVVIALLAVAVLAVMALPENVPPVGRVLDHALAHGTDVDNALFERESGSCCRTYRRPDCKRWIDLVGKPSAAFLYGVVRTTVGDVVTGYYAPRAYWDRKVSGWTMYTQTGNCGP